MGRVAYLNESAHLGLVLQFILRTFLALRNAFSPTNIPYVSLAYAK